MGVPRPCSFPSSGVYNRLTLKLTPLNFRVVADSSILGMFNIMGGWEPLNPKSLGFIPEGGD